MLNKHLFTKHLIIITLLALASNLFSQPTFISGQDPKPAGKAWSKVTNMSDEFEGTEVDLSKWQIEPNANGWVWIGRPPGLFEPEAVSVDSGRLRVTVSVLPAPETHNGNEYLYQGAIVRSLNPGVHGWYYEAKVKANKTEMSTTFWLMSQNSDCLKKCELDIQECVGNTTELTDSWGQNWDQIFHSNCIHRTTSCVAEATQIQGQYTPLQKNWERYFVYGAWWVSPSEVRFYLDGEYRYSITPSTDFDVPAWIQMAIETYSWNPVPDGGGKIATEDWYGRTTQYEWVRVWQLTDSPNQVYTDNNLVKNPGFENANYDYWNNTVSATISTSEQNTGLFAAEIAGSSTLSQVIRVYSGSTYEFSASAKTSGGTITIGIRKNNTSLYETTVTSTDYSTVEQLVTIDESDNEIEEIEIYFTTDAGETAYIDDAMLLGDKPPTALMNDKPQPAHICIKPNPAPLGEIITIQTKVPIPTHVKLKVYSNTGQMLHSRNMGMVNSGTYSIDVDTDSLNIISEGLYIFQIQAGGYTESYKLILK